MSLGRTIALALVGLLLTTSVAGANAVVASERTVLDSDYVKDSLDDSGFYGELHGELTDQIAADAGVSSGAAPGEIDPQRIVDEAITEAYVQSQVEGNIDRTYLFLHGNTEQLDLVIDLRPVKRNISAAVAEDVRNASMAELLDAAGAQAPEEGPEVDADRIARMTEDEESYEAVRTEFRADIRERILETAVDNAIENATNDELLALVIDDYNPLAYSEAEKEQMVDDRREEIRTAVREQIEAERGDEIDRTVDEELAATAEQVRQEAQTAPGDGDVPANVSAAAADIQVAVVEGLATEKSYDEFSGEIEAARDDLAEGIAAMVHSQLDEELPDRQSLTGEMPADNREQLDRAASMVQLLDTLVIALPILAVVLIGAIYLLTRSFAKTARTTGSTFLVIGAPAFLVTFYLRGQLPDLLASAGIEMEAGGMTDVMLSLADGVLATIASQSLALALVGLVLVGLSVAHARGYLDDLRDRGADAR